MFLLRYYCERRNEEIINLLKEIKEKYNIAYEILEWADYDKEREKDIYEKEFKPK